MFSHSSATTTPTISSSGLHAPPLPVPTCSKLLRYIAMNPAVLVVMCVCCIVLVFALKDCGASWLVASLKPERMINRYEGYRVTKGEICERVPLPSSSEEFFKDYQAKGKPVVIHVDGGFKSMGWNTDQWNEEYLSSKIGHLVVDLEKKVTEQRFGRKASRVRIPFSEFLHHTFSNNTSTFQYYLNLQARDRNRVLLPPLSYLTTDFTFPSFFLSGSLFAVNLWIGSSDPVAGTKSGLHHDEGDNLYVLIKGKKKVKLFSPGDSFNVYPIGYLLDVATYGHHTYCGHVDSHWSRIDLDLPEEEIRSRFPRFYDANYMECEVEGGEMLFIPHGWYHEVTSYGVHIAMNVWTDVINP